jgi:hypothetical protein
MYPFLFRLRTNSWVSEETGFCVKKGFGLCSVSQQRPAITPWVMAWSADRGTHRDDGKRVVCEEPSFCASDVHPVDALVPSVRQARARPSAMGFFDALATSWRPLGRCWVGWLGNLTVHRSHMGAWGARARRHRGCWKEAVHGVGVRPFNVHGRLSGLSVQWSRATCSSASSNLWSNQSRRQRSFRVARPSKLLFDDEHAFDSATMLGKRTPLAVTVDSQFLSVNHNQIVAFASLLTAQQLLFKQVVITRRFCRVLHRALVISPWTAFFFFIIQNDRSTKHPNDTSEENIIISRSMFLITPSHITELQSHTEGLLREQKMVASWIISCLRGYKSAKPGEGDCATSHGAPPADLAASLEITHI